MPEKTPPPAHGRRGGRRRAGGAPSAPTSAAGGPAHRAPVLVGLAALLVAGGVSDRVIAAPATTAAGVVMSGPVAAPAAALSSSWYCAGATATGAEAPGFLAVANDSDRAEQAAVTLVPDAGPHVASTVTVAAHTTAVLPEVVGSPAKWVAAEVNLDGGQAAVEQVVAGPQGYSGTPCASAGSASWWFAGGATLVNATDVISLFNPYATDAIVDLSFTTDQGREVPGDFQGIDVPARSLVAVDLGSHLRRRTQIATTVHARAGGRVVAFSTLDTTPPAAGEALLGAPPNPSNPTSADPAAPAAGLAVTLGASATATDLVWPSGDTGGGYDERYLIYDPGKSTAQVSLSIDLDAGQAQPYQFSVGPGQVTTIDADGQARIPPGVGHSATLRSTNGVGVVAVRLLTGVAPAPQQGSAVLPGEAAPADDWLVPAAAGAGATASLTVVPGGSDPLEVTVDGFIDGAEVALPGLAHVTVAPGQRSVLSLSGRDPGYSGSVVVRATGPVYLESDLAGAGGIPGLWLAPGIPLG